MYSEPHLPLLALTENTETTRAEARPVPIVFVSGQVLHHLGSDHRTVNFL